MPDHYTQNLGRGGYPSAGKPRTEMKPPPASATRPNDDGEFYYMQLRDGGARAIHRETGVDAVAYDAPVYTMNKDAARRDVLRQIEDAGLST